MDTVKAYTTKAPTGLTITRSGSKFTFSWKIGDKDYKTGQYLWYRIGALKDKVYFSDWTAIKLGASTTSKTITVDFAKYFPVKTEKMPSITFRVRGERGIFSEKITKTVNKKKVEETITYVPSMSAWREKTMSFAIPSTPSMTAELSEKSNETTFAWSAANNTTSARHFYRTQRQTIRVRASNQTDGSKLPWKSTTDGWSEATGSASGSMTVKEDSTILSQDSYTRWVRVRSQGCAGNSVWRYAKHVYATPYVPTINSASASANTAGGYTTVNMKWTANANASHPIDETKTEYVFTTPAANLVCPSTASWTEATTQADTAGLDGARFVADQIVGTDECLYVRVKCTHDSNVSYSAAKLVAKGKLAAPTDVSVETNASTHRATITATNNSDVPDSRLAVIYKTASNPNKQFVIGIIPHGETSVQVACPDWTGDTVAFGVYAFQGSATAVKRADGVGSYAITANMTSATVWKGGEVPVAPTNVSVTQSDEPGEVIVTWGWSWKKATLAEVSWSTNPNAWESTDEPQTYTIGNLNAAKWRISGLETGMVWYVRVRLAVGGDEPNYGPYSDAVAVDLSSAPAVPTLVLSGATVVKNQSFTASWAYVSTDGTAQALAEICLATVSSSGIKYGKIIGRATTQQNKSIGTTGWTTGSTYYLCVRVTSTSGQTSDWSNPVPIRVADPLVCAITDTSLVMQDIEDDDGDVRSVRCLTEMPFTATIVGADTGGITTLIIERAMDYHMTRPDDSDVDGYEGETIVLYRQLGEAKITITNDDLIGRLDDGAPYRLVAMVTDGLGQSATASLDFEVHWEHQAGIPTATVEIDDLVAKITAIAPAEYEEGDYCDIYRLSADRPEPIVFGGIFGETYVDPYPTLGESGGHRIVHRTANGDYITSSNQPAWTDIGLPQGDYIDEFDIIVDFGGYHLRLPYNLTLSNNWQKDFKKTNYLGGSQQGDWNPAVNRSASYSVDLIADDDSDTIEGMRRLADYNGICHIRTPEGSSYACNIEVSEKKVHSNWDTVSYTLSVTRVDPESLDGMTLEEWSA